MAIRIIETARFSATAANGQRHTIIELTEMLDATTLSDTRRQALPDKQRKASERACRRQLRTG